MISTRSRTQGARTLCLDTVDAQPSENRRQAVRLPMAALPPQAVQDQWPATGRRVKLDRGDPDNGIRDTERQARRGSSKQPQRIHKVGPPECAVTDAAFDSLHTQRLCGNRQSRKSRKFGRVVFAGRVAHSACGSPRPSEIPQSFNIRHSQIFRAPRPFMANSILLSEDRNTGGGRALHSRILRHRHTVIGATVPTVATTGRWHFGQRSR